MPNDHDKNWCRMCATIVGFKNKFGEWPTRIMIHQGAMDDLERVIFTPEGLQRVGATLQIIVEPETQITADDGGGRRLEYGHCGLTPGDESNQQVEKWLGTRPDLPHPGWW